MIKQNTHIMQKHLLLFYFIFIQLSLFAQLDPNNNLDNYVEIYLNNTSAPSLSAGISQDGIIKWSKYAGYADLENSVFASNLTKYRIASISKSITAVAVMQLFETGKIKLDEKITAYLTDIPKLKWVPTVRQLLNHTSGFRAYINDEFDNKKYFPTLNSVLNEYLRDSMVYEPGTRYLYSSLAYNLLGAIVEKVTSKNFVYYVKEKILIPAKMFNTVPDEQKTIILNRAKGYVKDVYRTNQNCSLADLSIKICGGGYLSTLEDLLNFGNAIISGKLIKQNTLDEMLKPVKLKDGSTRSYGLGFSLEKDQKGRFYFGHVGSGTGFISNLVIYPVEKLVAVHLINMKDNYQGNPAVDLSTIYLDNEQIIFKKPYSNYLIELYGRKNIDEIITDIKHSYNSSSNIEYSQKELQLFGSNLEKLKHYLNAEKYYKYLLTKYPKDSCILLSLSNVYYNLNKKKLAKNNISAALKIDPQNPQIKELSNKIDKMK